MKKLLLMVLAAWVLVVPGTSAAQQWFDYNGQTLLPAAVGGDLTMYARVTNNGSIATPIPLSGTIIDRYTLVITGLTLMADGTMQTYAGGTIQLIEDDATLADFNNPASFTDGTVILEGTFVSFTRAQFGSLISGGGTVNWTGGTRVDEIAPADRLGWAFVVSITTRVPETLPGFDENWNGKVEPSDPIVPGAVQTWGTLKRQF